jgi:hypothetical protein
MITLLIDLQEFQIIPEKDLSDIMNEKQHGPFILAHAICKLHKFDSTVEFFYPNFKKQFKKKSIHTLPMAGILKCEFSFFIQLHPSFNFVSQTKTDWNYPHLSFITVLNENA